MSSHPHQIAVLSFLSRADATPFPARRRSAGHLLDHDGAILVDPAADPARHAFGSDPNLNFETWGDYWRKVHGVRFLHAEGDDAILDRLLRYDQIHRVAAAPSGLTPPPYHPPLDADGRLHTSVIGQLPPYRRPAWDGAAYLVFAERDDVAAVLGSARVRRAIMPEDRVMFREIAPLLARQHVVLPGPDGRDAVTMIRTHTRRAGVDRHAVQDHWRGAHADLVLAQPDTRRLLRSYVQLHNIGPQAEGEPFFHAATAPFDVVSLLGFATMSDAEEFCISDGARTISDAEAQVMIPAGHDDFTGVTFHLRDRIAPASAARQPTVPVTD
ncbi:EthD domain-containing protein [Bradyrhizobium sp. U87765 SZCCT0131]|uniref:EthD domain-containing protein n=1 Tax=unclassified Bradyrhizobium TaxID=2631580 RepID=UPI001BA48CD7|nr:MULTISPECIES: EthD domain-containing protein [unclassified Bradyrhizobium]MBR1221324.1 EthD domain-containing protein [Bradyrhizobium sp. U87765 SZCCT0131]MBR1264753.1 EthD domain-containing protein [Bradyrhizobium sp. U87765 SZCCT0134]MBR1304341.1 EthD domain-containing protein [Bradyrhizobium sp. U87765 SZCCT0110]MBR1322802.1 EthD domain-containing protein [Bradyrhizobium sp. U87765 SZCCT0109]MBR1346270.1 EthD domain-containing protein [Bradyrhizobium sp. U87765 SZCCT0048]